MAVADLRSVAFPVLRDDQVTALARCAAAMLRRYPDGQVLIKAGDRNFKFFVVKSGPRTAGSSRTRSWMLRCAIKTLGAPERVRLERTQNGFRWVFGGKRLYSVSRTSVSRTGSDA